MKLYHGGLTAVNSPRIIRSEIGRDFGFAFYTTDIKEQAERWAYRRQRAAIRNGCSSAQAIVSVFEFDEAASRKNLEFLDFPEANLAWLDLVVACRSDCTFTHGKDVITGNVQRKTGFRLTKRQVHANFTLHLRFLYVGF